MDITKAKAAIEVAGKLVQDLVTATAMAAAKDPQGVKGIGSLVKAGEKLADAAEWVEDALDRATPKPKEDKKTGDKKK